MKIDVMPLSCLITCHILAAVIIPLCLQSDANIFGKVSLLMLDLNATICFLGSVPLTFEPLKHQKQAK